MTDFIEEKAFAKLNISLDVRNRRPDGYHNMTMVMQTVSLHDVITLKRTGNPGISARCSMPFIPCDERNLAVKAARLYLETAGVNDCGVNIDMQKNIPVGAGLAGGSADAAAVLRGLNRMFDGRLSKGELLTLADKTGSDVPFCLLGGTMLAKGRGEVLEPLPPMPDCSYVICKPSFSISTPELFRAIDGKKLRRHPDTAGIVQALEKENLEEICRRMYNVFEDVGDRRMRTVSEIKGMLMDCGADGTLMTGTGSAVFGVFRDPVLARHAAETAKKSVPFSTVAENVGKLLE